MHCCTSVGGVEYRGSARREVDAVACSLTATNIRLNHSHSPKKCVCVCCFMVKVRIFFWDGLDGLKRFALLSLVIFKNKGSPIFNNINNNHNNNTIIIVILLLLQCF